MAPKRRQWPRAVLAAVIAAALAYPVAGNVLLWSGALAKIVNKKPDKLKIQWAKAWTLWPGTIHVEDFSVDIHGRKRRTLITVDRGTVLMDLLSLTSKTVDISGAQAEGVEVVSTRRPPPDTGGGGGQDTAGAAASTPAPGDASPPTAPAAGKKPWTIDLKGVHATGVRLVQFNDLRLEGAGELRELGMRVVTKGGPLRIDALGLDMAVDATPEDEDVAKFARLSVDIRIAENVPGRNKGRKILKFVSGRMTVAGDASSIKFVGALLGDRYNLSVSGGGRLDLVMVVESGELMDGSRIHFSSDRFETDFLDLHAEGAGEIVGEVDGDRATPGNFSISVRDFMLHRRGVPNPYMEGADLSIELLAKRFLLHDALEEGRLFVHFPDATVRDLTDYNRFIPKQANVEIIEGRGKFRGTISILGDNGHFNVELDGSDVLLDVGGTRIGTDFRLVANLGEGNYSTKNYDLSGTYFRLENTQLGRGDDLTRDGWWGEIRIDEGDLVWSEPMDIDAKMRVRMRDTEPLIALLREAGENKTLLDRALTIKDVEGVLGVQTNERDIVLDPIQVRGKGLQIISRLDFLENSINGVLYAKLHGIAANFEIKDNRAKFKGLGGKDKVKEAVDQQGLLPPREGGGPLTGSPKNIM